MHSKPAHKEVEFTAPMENVSVPLGKDGVFTCKINQIVHADHLQVCLSIIERIYPSKDALLNPKAYSTSLPHNFKMPKKHFFFGNITQSGISKFALEVPCCSSDFFLYVKIIGTSGIRRLEEGWQCLDGIILTEEFFEDLIENAILKFSCLFVLKMFQERAFLPFSSSCGCVWTRKRSWPLRIGSCRTIPASAWATRIAATFPCTSRVSSRRIPAITPVRSTQIPCPKWGLTWMYSVSSNTRIQHAPDLISLNTTIKLLIERISRQNAQFPTTFTSPKCSFPQELWLRRDFGWFWFWHIERFERFSIWKDL